MRTGGTEETLMDQRPGGALETTVLVVIVDQVDGLWPASDRRDAPLPALKIIQIDKIRVAEDHHKLLLTNSGPSIDFLRFHYHHPATFFSRQPGMGNQVERA